MPSILALTIVLAVLMMVFGGKQGTSSFFSVLLNFKRLSPAAGFVVCWDLYFGDDHLYGKQR